MLENQNTTARAAGFALLNRQGGSGGWPGPVVYTIPFEWYALWIVNTGTAATSLTISRNDNGTATSVIYGAVLAALTSYLVPILPMDSQGFTYSGMGTPNSIVSITAAGLDSGGVAPSFAAVAASGGSAMVLPL